jgi:hypothetical protein
MPGVRRALIPAALAAALAISACGGGSSSDTAAGPHVSPAAFNACLNKRGVETGPPGSDAVLASYAQQAVAEGGATFVIVHPPSQVIAFSQNVDLEQAKSALGTAEQQGGLRADGLHAATFGNVLIAYFAATPPAATSAIERCLGGKATPLSGFSEPYNAPDTTTAPQGA